MLIKLGIIAGIVILGVMIFATEIENISPTTATAIDSLNDDVTNFGIKASDSIEQRIDESGKIVNEASNTLTNEITEAKESSQKIINEEISNFNPIESIKNIFTGN